MTRIATLLFLLLLSAGAHSAGSVEQIGVAVAHGNSICFSIEHPGLPTPAAVTLILPDSPQSIAQAEITGPGPGCPGLKNSDAVGYKLRVTRGHVHDNIVMIGVLDGEAVLRQGRVISKRPGNNDRVETFRSCTSADGVHLTVWRGSPLSGVRLWHAYYYLGQDLVPTCTDEDTAP
ncbi:MAG TPA: hypothetical protein VLI93_16860 [Acetobacteraceae bacterium]|nr:hypothetical protein [Acetobacteraceae bacterium]